MSRARRVVPIAAIVVAALLPSPLAHADTDRASQSGEPSATATARLTPGEWAVRLTNRRRVAHGLASLRMVYKPRLTVIRHSRWQARIDRMTHLGPRGGDAGDRLTSVGYRWRLWGENVAAGQRTAHQVVRAWMASPGHRANMLNRAARHIAVARAWSADGTPYWTMVVTAR
jgi:uncharacterized protein YkwD